MTFTSFAPLDLVCHVKTGNIYKILGRCTYEPTGIDCYSYCSESGRVWVRPTIEMEDGRFVLTDQVSRD